jgi:hypothetical protein
LQDILTIKENIMTQQTATQTNVPAQLAARFNHVPADISMRCEGAEPVCPQCGAPCNHTPQEMQGFAMDAAEEASAGLARDEDACRRANEAEAAALADPVAAYRGNGDNVESKTIALLTQQVAELRSSPPASFIALENDGTFKGWLRMLGDSSTTGKMRKAIIRSVRELVTACAEAQRSASETTVYQAVMAGNWLPMTSLPAPYEEVRILVDGMARIARLAHDKTHFQLATFLVNTKNQYLVSVDKVQGWQPLFAAPGHMAPPASAIDD